MSKPLERDRLVAGLAAGDEAAWRIFVEEYGRLIYSIAANFNLEDSDREDLFQETCFTALRSVATLRNPARLASWVYTIAYRLLVQPY